MKIVCDACGAKYAIADEKVRGKVFKIRCKKCSNVIVVRGLSGEGEASDEQLSQQETRTFGYDEQEGAEPASSEGVWHLVIDQDQIGPITDDEVRARFARGEIDRDTYAWREGFGDWQPLGAIDVFADLGQAGSGRHAAAAAASVESPSADPFAGASGGDGGGDLFGGANSGDGLFGGSGAGSANDKRLRGERNENSVLFSLGNLAALASDAPKPVAAPVSSLGGGAGRAQAGGSEGSGLIDIRSMAQTYMGNKDRAVAAPMSSFSAIEPVTFPTQSPVLLPTTPAGGGGSNKTLIAAIIGGSAAVVVAVVVVLIIVLRGNEGPTVADGTGTPATGTPAGDPAGTPDTAATPDTAKPDTTATAAGAGGTQTGTTEPAGTGTTPTTTPPADIAGKKPEDPKTTRTPTSGRDRPDTGSKPRDEKTEKPADKPEEKPADKPAAGGGCLDEVGCLLADKPPACCSKYSGGGGGGGGRKPSGGGGGDSNLPEKLTRSDITAGINKVRSGVTACSSKGSGEVKVTVKVNGSGSVGDVSVKSAPNAALGTCVANAVKKASFAKTQEGATFTYPFVF